MNRPTRLLSLALTLWATHAALPDTARAGLIPIFDTAEDVDHPPPIAYSFLIQFFQESTFDRLTAGDSLVLSGIPGGTGSAPGLPFDVSTSPTATATATADPGLVDVAFTYNGPDLTANAPFHGTSPFGFTLTADAPIGPLIPYWNAAPGFPGGPEFGLLAPVPVAVPEPAGVVLMGLGGLGLAGVAWRRERRRTG